MPATGNHERLASNVLQVSDTRTPVSSKTSRMAVVSKDFGRTVVGLGLATRERQDTGGMPHTVAPQDHQVPSIPYHRTLGVDHEP